MVAKSTASKKAKGRLFQQKIRDDIIKYIGIHEHDILSTGMGQSGLDIYLAGSARQKFPYGIECKSQESIQIWAAIKQCEVNAIAAGLTPLLLFKRNHTEPHVVLLWSDFLKLVL